MILFPSFILYSVFFPLWNETTVLYTPERGPRLRIREVACDYFFGRGGGRDSVPVSLTIYISLCAEQCGSGMFIPDPNFSFQGQKIPEPGSGSTSKNKLFLSFLKYDLGCSSRIRILNCYPSWIPDPRFKNAPGPGSGSATLVQSHSVIAAVYILKKSSNE